MKWAEQSLGKKSALELSENSTVPKAIPGQSRLPGAYTIAVELIEPDANQPRKKFHEPSFKQLVASVREVGILQALSVRQAASGGRYIIISGERRFRAAREVGLTEVPCWVQSPADNEILVRQIVENWQRADLHPFDLADTIAHIRDEMKLSQREIAHKTGKPESEISRFLALLNLQPDIQREARDDSSGEIGRRHLVAISKLPAEEQRKALDEVRAKRLSAEETEQMVQGKIVSETAMPKRGVANGPRQAVQSWPSDRRSHDPQEERHTG